MERTREDILDEMVDYILEEEVDDAGQLIAHLLDAKDFDSYKILLSEQEFFATLMGCVGRKLDKENGSAE